MGGWRGRVGARRWRSAAGVALLLYATAVASEDPADSRLASVAKLIELSSAAQRVAASGNALAQALHDDARKSLAAARDADAQGDAGARERELGEALQSMLDATRAASAANVTADDDEQRRFDTALASVDALNDAYHRIRAEADMDANDELGALVDAKRAAAVALRADGAVAEALSELDAAYAAAKVGIEHLRGGATLVRSLQFDSPEQEYAYELDRNDTHRMLIDVLLKERLEGNATLAGRVAEHVRVASEHRMEAVRRGRAASFTAAIESLEAATAELVLAIRSAGVYIPR